MGNKFGETELIKLQSFSGFKYDIYIQGGNKIWSIPQNHLIVEHFFFFLNGEYFKK